MACEELFLERLRKSGFRLTPQREMVLSVLHQLEGAATAEDIYARVRALSSAVDISTVYRTLDLLRELELVACIDAGGEQYRYELLGAHGPHLHLACGSCGAIIGVELDQAEPFVARLRAAYGFEARLDEVTIPGLCCDCQVEGTP
ncbi:MAG: transcriptional repressor [Anaerolineae bacterium]|jgi:Fur family ferric uptake transcriptional regulator|nr:transcriptional repressor [Anaerolineae bacterium]